MFCYENTFKYYIPFYPNPVYRPPPRPVKIPSPEIAVNMDINPELNIDFEENSPFQEGVISEMYQRPYKSYYQEPRELESLINTGRLVQKFLPNLAHMDKILKNNTEKGTQRHTFTCFNKGNTDRILGQSFF